MNFSKKMKNFAMLSVACMSTGLTALAPVVSANTAESNTYVKYNTRETANYTRNSYVDVKLTQQTGVPGAQVEVFLKQYYDEAPDVYFVFGEHNCIPLERTASGSYIANLTDEDLKGSKDFHVEIISKIPYGTHKHIVESKSFKLESSFRR
ncbi:MULTISPECIES: hypothetical protein [Streptococcus]|uniref:Uncharacterized protein n=1 Tax=Streptococcus suis TaxID=1307 RepID=A0A0Z8NVT2_STRSU|nr:MULTISPECIES: hypothetical protein [Streptococcus]AWX95353.1 hypothetical protein BKM66_04095 [Streptococcus suis]AWX97302.1 hypothetical protein BKM67_04380 [Streptococcus suis]MBL6438906.1 hypothetical protein [Streptococcus suis]MBL6504649.1 hypothetical protein [Streptococcus suis]MBM0240613.1 hypothetical protein [Streptococcus suis]